MPLTVNPQIIGRTAPTLLDLTVAVFTGVAGSFALVRRDVSNILAGVAIAISLVPVLAVVGITLGSGEYEMAWGAFILFLTNAAAIIVVRRGRVHGGGLPAGRRRARRPHRQARQVDHRRPRRDPGGRARGRLGAHLRLPVVRQRDGGRGAGRGPSGSQWTVETVDLVGNAIVATAVGPGDPPPLDELRAAVRETGARRSCP